MPENNNTKIKNKTAESEYGWKDTVITMIKSFFENFFEELLKNVKQKVELFAIKFKNNLISLILVVVGLIFLAVGMAVALNFLIGIPGLGYLIIGILLLVLGMIIKMRNQ